MKYKVGDKVILTNGDTMTIYQINNILKWYIMREDPLNCYTDEMIEGLVEEKKTLDEAGLETDFEYEGLTYTLPEGYIFKDENNNVINTTKIVLEKKKKEYPKTYEECCDILEDVADCSLSCFACGLLNNLQKLLLCRAAYWQIAGEEMGLGKPWEPDWKNDEQFKYIIICRKGCIIKDTYTAKDVILSFPTEEMRDAFYENFKEEIESVKELL